MLRRTSLSSVRPIAVHGPCQLVCLWPALVRLGLNIIVPLSYLLAFTLIVLQAHRDVQLKLKINFRCAASLNLSIFMDQVCTADRREPWDATMHI